MCPTMGTDQRRRAHAGRLHALVIQQRLRTDTLKPLFLLSKHSACAPPWGPISSDARMLAALKPWSSWSVCICLQAWVQFLTGVCQSSMLPLRGYIAWFKALWCP